eukprot:362301-Chlamydomonas_euryale.AAC.3
MDVKQTRTRMLPPPCLPQQCMPPAPPPMLVCPPSGAQHCPLPSIRCAGTIAFRMARTSKQVHKLLVFRKKIGRVSEWLHDNHVPEQTRKRVKAYFTQVGLHRHASAHIWWTLQGPGQPGMAPRAEIDFLLALTSGLKPYALFILSSPALVPMLP